MELAIGVSVVMCLSVLAGIIMFLRKFAFGGGDLPVTAEWIDELSIERYRPMMRLLDSGDIEFLRSQPGFTPKMEAKLRIQRTQIFRGYLRSLSSDFGRVCAAIKLVMLHSKQDRPDLATAIIRQQIIFAAGMFSVQFRLFLYRWGFCGVDVTALVHVFDGMRLELRTLVPSAMPMGA
jgi:hypothetical protein